MPKKRTTKNQDRATSIAVAEQKEVGEGMTMEQKKAKLDILLDDFDAEVETRVSKMRRDVDKMCSAVSKLYRIELLKLPKNYRDMTCVEYFAVGGNINTDALKEVDNIVGSLNNASKENLIRSTCQTIKEDEEINCNSATFVASVNTLPQSRNRKAPSVQNQSVNMPPPITTNRLRPRTRTPFTSNPFGKTSWSTPAVTPKFDPNLPLSSYLTRQAKIGEKIMSLSGSPLVNTADLFKNATDAVIILADGQTLPFSEKDETPILDYQTRKKMQLLHKKLGALLISPNS